MATGNNTQSSAETLAGIPFALIGVQMALKAAIELRVFDILAESGPPGTQLSAPQIASKIPSTNLHQAIQPLHRILRFLISHFFLTTSLPLDSTIDDVQSRLFGLTPLTASTMVVQKDGSALPMIGSLLLLYTEKEMWECLDKLKYAVLDPNQAESPFETANGVGWYDYLAQRPGSHINMLFDQFLGGSNKFFCGNMMSIYHGFNEVVELMDVGGNDGSGLEPIIALHPQIKASINFDLSNVIARAPIVKVEQCDENHNHNQPKVPLCRAKVVHNMEHHNLLQLFMANVTGLTMYLLFFCSSKIISS